MTRHTSKRKAPKEWRNHLTLDLRPKQGYETAARAKGVATHLNHGQPRAVHVEHYRCATCGLWHVGHKGRP